MSIAVSNVATTDTFQIWLNRTNTLLEFMSNQAIHANAATGVTTGNAQLVGYFGADVLATPTLRGGNVSTSDVLTITSDVDIDGGSLKIANTEVINSSAGWATDLAVAGLLSATGNVSGPYGLFATNVNTALFSVGAAFTANSTQVNAVSFHVGNNFIANSTVVNAASFTVGTDVTISNTGIVTNFLTAAGLIFPSADGTPGQAIVTDGANTLSFASLLTWATAVDNDIVPDTSATYNFGNSSTSFAKAFIDVLSSVAADINIQVQEQDVIVANTTTVDLQDTALIGFNAGVNAQTGTTHTLTADDNGKILVFSNNSAVTLTLENSLSAGFTCGVIQKGGGTITFTEEAGANLVNRQGHSTSAGQYAICTLYVDENSGGTSAVYFLGGDTA